MGETRALPLVRALLTDPKAAKPINLALQGGGAHGAFTWGVLDRLLEDGRLRFEGVSGTSAGAVNAVALAAGLAEGGPEAARAKLEEVWRGVSQASCCHPLRSLPPDSRDGTEVPSDSAGHIALDVLTRVFSPYDLNPLDIDPLRDVLEGAIDFKSVRRAGAPELFLAATEVSTGRARIFTSSEVSLDVVLASACLPTLRKAVKIGRHHYWDGGFSANPALMPLVR
ncbi:MAG: patatin-like phospholipase family protein, partial [Kiloniellales bacterium]|nr:patatin-like phospholipase family protein [Kiloniellales bacterium]